MEKELQDLKAAAEEKIAHAKNLEEIESIRVGLLGRKGELTKILSKMPELSKEERPKIGKLGNIIKKELQGKIDSALKTISEEALEKEIGAEKIDATLPGFGHPAGTIHPITQAMDEIVDIFTGMGFWVEHGPDIESDYNNFEALNIGKDHPARDMQDTFYVNEEVVLRTHTSPVQIRTMKKYDPPVRVICPGRVYRCDSDLTHSPMFHQVEGFMVDDTITFGDLKGVLMSFIHQCFGPDLGIRFRPSYFPFTEPSAEVDMECVMCKGEGCNICKDTGWLEILGAGSIHPEVLKNVGYDPDKVTGFAFGMGVERIAMLKYGIPHIRSFFENDIRFLRQF